MQAVRFLGGRGKRLWMRLAEADANAVKKTHERGSKCAGRK